MPISKDVFTAMAGPLRLASALLLFGFLTVHSGNAGTLAGGLGFDYQSGPRSQSNRSALAFGSAQSTAGDLTLAAIRYGDSELGPGTGAFANAGVLLGQRVHARGILLRAFGDHGYRAWRWRAGPEFQVGSNRTLGLYYLRLTNNAQARFGSAGAELSATLTPSLSGQIGTSYGRWNTDATTTQGSVSGTWQPRRRVILLCEVDVGRNLTTTSAAGPSSGGGIGGLPLPGGIGGGGSGPAQTSTKSEVSAAGQIGIRFLIH